MPSRVLLSLLALCGVVALWPSVMWVSARYLDRIDDRWMDSIGATGVTLPIALGLAALLLVVHGLRVNARFREDVALEAEERLQLTALQMAPAEADRAVAGAAVATGMPRTASVSASRAPAGAAPAAGGAVAAPPAAKAGGKSAKDKAIDKGKRRGKSIAKREVKKAFRSLRN